MENRIKLERLNELLEYNQDTGNFTWKISRGRSKKGTKAGTKAFDGYLRIAIDGKNYMAHHLVWFYVRGAWPNSEIDHKNQIKDDNRIDNLREVNRSENNQNKPMRKDNKSGFRGVYWHKLSRKWGAEIAVDGISYYLGLFNNPEDASRAYQVAAKKLHTHRPTNEPLDSTKDCMHNSGN